MIDIKLLESKLHIKIKNASLFETALTHPSYNLDANTVHQDYERLEYIGDAVLDFVSADLIFNLRPELQPGEMTKMRSNLVKSHTLAEYSRKIGLGNLIILGHSIDRKQMLSGDHVLENVFESIIGAIYLDSGIEVTKKFISSFIKKEIINYNMDLLTDAKSLLQEQMQAEHRDSVSYVLVKEEGPAHDRVFTVNVLFNDIVLATGVGKSKKAAQEDAARKALSKRVV